MSRESKEVGPQEAKGFRSREKGKKRIRRNLPVPFGPEGLGPFFTDQNGSLSERPRYSSYTFEILLSSLPAKADISTKIEELVLWVQPDFRPDILRSAFFKRETSDYAPIFSRLDLALAVAHGFIRFQSKYQNDASVKQLIIKYSNAEELSACACQVLLLPNESKLVQFGQLPQEHTIWDLGGIPYFPFPDASYESLSRRALLIKIGYFQLSLPTWLFSEIIIIDPRPTESGGLPDFWEATVARLIAQVEGNSNIEVLFVLGDLKYGAMTVAKLKSISDWNKKSEQIAYKTGMPVPSITTAASRIEGKIEFPDTEDALLSRLSNVLSKSINLQEITQPNISADHHRYLKFELRMDSMALDKNDGCRVKTIAEAYPVVLEIARNALDQAIIMDQAGQQLRELTDFKVFLTQPSVDLVPEFYSGETETLEDYFNREFLSQDGLFGNVLRKTGQVEAVLNHLIKAIMPPDQFATRRAVLVIPHEIREGDDVSPLGLISIRIIPRYNQNRVSLSYSFTWRTVEAFVGFPYSLYGSVRYSQYLTEEIKKRLRETSTYVDMGSVSYVAHSLHIFMDYYGQNIARKISYEAGM